MRTPVPTSSNPLVENSGAPVARGRVTAVHAGWRSVAKRVITCTTCAMTVSSLLLPNVTWAAEWVDVEGVRYDTAHNGGSWAWDGANDLALNNYTGGPISAAGELNITYSGANAVTGTGNRGISVTDGKNEDASLSISNKGEGSLAVTEDSDDAIYCDGNIDISGSGTVQATSTGDYTGIKSDSGDVSISGSGNVRAEGTNYEGIEANNVTISSSGTVEAIGEDYGIGASGDLVITGGGKTTAKGYYGVYASGNLDVSNGSSLTAHGEHGINCSGDSITVSGGSKVDAAASDGIGINGCSDGVFIRDGSIVTVTSKGDRGVDAYGALAIEGGSTLTVTADGDDGVNAGDKIVVDASTVKSTSMLGSALYSSGGPIIIRNGSLVEALATTDEKNGAIYSCGSSGVSPTIDISDSTVTAIQKYADGSGPEDGESSAIFAETQSGVDPAVISIKRSNVTASGGQYAILSGHGYKSDDELKGDRGTIHIEDSNIALPQGAHIANIEYDHEYQLLYGKVHYLGQTLAIGDNPTGVTPGDDAIVKEVTTKAPEAPEPTPAPDPAPAPEPSEKPADTVKPAAASAKPTAAKTASKVAADLPQTGDRASIVIAAFGAAGVAALAIGAAALRRRLS